MQTRNFRPSFFSFLLALSLTLTGCSQTILPSNANSAFENFTMNLFKQDVASNTISLHYSLHNPQNYGITEAPVTFGSFDFNETTSLAALENCSAALEKFPYHSLSEKNQLTYDILSSYLETAGDCIPYMLYEEPLSPITGVQAQLPVLLAEYQFTCLEDAETYLALIATMPEYFSSLIKFEQKKSEAGLFMADYTVDAILQQCNAFIHMGEANYLLSTFEERLDTLDNVSDTERKDLITRNKELLTSAVLPAYENLINALEKLKGTGTNTQGLCFLPKGKDYYALVVARDTGSSRSIEAIEKLTYAQISSDLLDIQSVVANNPNLTQTSSILQSETPEEILNHLKEKISITFPDPAPVTTCVKYVPKALESYLSPAFYLIPAIDNTLENVIYINQASTPSGMDLFTTLAHEGYPGHLYQTTYFASTDPDPIRTILNFEGYVEGWATYAEMGSYFLSPLEKPYATLMQKNNSLILGLYAAADIGIHYKGWDIAQTLEFFGSYGIEDAEVIEEIYELIISDPGNYLKYYLGYLEILELKKDIIQKDEKNFSQKTFHKAVLDIGPAPFDVIRKHLGL